MNVEPWWEEYPSVLDEELGALESAGFQPEVIESDKKSGCLNVKVNLPIFGTDSEGIIQYPDLYPYFRPALNVIGLGDELRHYNPYSGNICLLTRGTEHWNPGPGNTAAWLITTMLPSWEAVARNNYENERLVDEDFQAEPSVEYLPTTKRNFYLDSSWTLPSDIDTGSILFYAEKGFNSIRGGEEFSAWVSEIRDVNNKTIAGCEISSGIDEWIKLRRNEEVSCKWFRLSAILTSSNLEDILGGNQQLAKWFANKIRKIGYAFFGACMPEENPSGGSRDGWLFYYITPRGAGLHIEHMKASYAGEKDLLERIPELVPLRNKNIAIVGLGCVGAPSAIAFAKAGVGEIRLLDGDNISPGTTCRWPLGLEVVGQGKVRAILDFIKRNYPMTQVGINHHMNGEEDFGLMLGGFSGIEREYLYNLFKGVDLIYDATAEYGVNHLLADYAKKLGIPYVSVASRAGGWGGSIVRIRPVQANRCFLCYLQALEENEDMHPAHDPDGDRLQPVGCGDVTFHAAGFDVEEISLAGVRIAVSTLCEDTTGQRYPKMDLDIGILFLRRDGIGLFPLWKSYGFDELKPCDFCAEK